MELKSGYKQTELGIVPVDWNVTTFKKICWVNQGLQIPIERRLKYPTHQSKIYITIQFLNNGKEVEYIDEYSSSVCCEKEEILMTRTGNTGIVVSGVEGVFHNNFFKINFEKNQLDRDFLIYFLNQKQLQKIILIKAGTSTIPDLNHSDFYSIPIIFPSISEQRAIAAALSDVDALLTALDALIAKKRLAKQGAMQELLTGKRRLAGFSGEWKTTTIGEMFQFLNTANNSRSELSDNGSINYIHYGDIHTKWKSFLDFDREALPFINEEKVKNIPLLEDGDLVMADASEDYAGVGVGVEIKNINGRKVVAGLHTLLLRANKEILADGFKGYLQYIPSLKDALIKIATGISVYGISKTNMKNIGSMSRVV